MIFFTSDHHFMHSRIIEYTDRPFSNVDEMDAEMISRWNSVVEERDVVYHLGDFTLGGSNAARKYFRQLNGRIQVLANPWHHDRRWLPRHPGSTIVQIGLSEYYSRGGYKVEILPPMVVLEFKEFGKTNYPLAIVLCHYPLARWDRYHYDSCHLFGHSHGKYSTKDLAFDVGVDSNNFTPVSLDEVIIKVRRKQ